MTAWVLEHWLLVLVIAFVAYVAILVRLFLARWRATSGDEAERDDVVARHREEERVARQMLGVSREEAFAMLDRGELEGTLAGSTFESLRWLAGPARGAEVAPDVSTPAGENWPVIPRDAA